MKKEIFNTLTKWHQEQKSLLGTKQAVRARALPLFTLPSAVENKEQAIKALSQVLEEKISPSDVFMGAPINRYPTDLPLGCGFMYKVPNLGWILIWLKDKNILFLDKAFFDAELIPQNHPFVRESLSHGDELKRMTIIAVIMVILILISLLFV